MHKLTIGGYERVSKQKARKVFESGGAVYLAPCKARLDGMLGYPAEVKRELSSTDNRVFDEFQTVINAFEYYNCNYSELGKYTAYYLKEGGAEG